MVNTAVRLVVAAVLTRADGRVLVQRRPIGKPLAGLWEFPGGRVEPGELPEAALARELGEELGIAVEERALEPRTFASEPQGALHLLLLFYRCHRWAGEPEARHADALRWATPADLIDLPMPGPDRPAVALLAASPPGERGGGGEQP